MLKLPYLKAKTRILLFLALALLLYLPAKWSLLRAESDTDITIGSKNFTESRILAELYSQALEKSGYQVRRRFDLGGTLIAHAALTRGEIDMYPEYTGTGMLNVLQQAPGKDEHKVYATLNREYGKRWRLKWLLPAEANDSQALVVTKQTAKKNRLYTLSDLAKLSSHLKLATIPEFEDREDGLRGLRTVYGNLAFKQIRQYDNALKYRVLMNKNADVTVGFTTDGDLANPQLVLLEDDRHFWPKYRVAPVLREAVLKKNKKIQNVLDGVSKQLDTATLRRLNAKVDIDKQDYRAVAHDFLATQEKMKNKGKG